MSIRVATISEVWIVVGGDLGCDRYRTSVYLMGRLVGGCAGKSIGVIVLIIEWWEVRFVGLLPIIWLSVAYLELLLRVDHWLIWLHVE